MGRFEEILVVLVLIVFFFGKNKLPGLGKAMGQFMDEFKKATGGQSAKDESKEAKPVLDVNEKDEPAKPQLALPPSASEKRKPRKKLPAKKKKTKVKAKR
ncbi:MAG: Sec-independent protein translocase subunit TatA/TatB [bacterium]